MRKNRTLRLRTRFDCRVLPGSVLWGKPGRRLQQLAEFALIELRHSCRAMARSAVARRDKQHAAIPDALDLAVEHSKLRRIALVIGRIAVIGRRSSATSDQ